jgi:hypothetical protein
VTPGYCTICSPSLAGLTPTRVGLTPTLALRAINPDPHASVPFASVLFAPSPLACPVLRWRARLWVLPGELSSPRPFDLVTDQHLGRCITLLRTFVLPSERSCFKEG